MQWNTIPTKLQRELFDTAGSMGDVLKSAALRGQIARFLHKHNLTPPSWNLGDWAPAGRVLDLEHLARSAVDPLAADQHVPFAKRRLVSVQSLDSRHAHLHRSGPVGT